jgi:hypothetical protein
MSAIHTPKFSADGKKIYFTWHVNGKMGEQLAVFDLTNEKTSVLLADGAMNRFPAVNPAGDAYFVSDRTGVDNIYVYRDGSTELVTNTETGFRFPAFDNEGRLYADVFSYKGWEPAEVEQISPISPASVTIAPPPAPPADENSDSHAEFEQHEIQDYSIIPSIWPRQWAPLLFVYNNGYFAGAQVSGFDAVDRHRYVLGIAYDSFSSSADAIAVYSNRSFGPDLSISAESFTTDI